MTHKPLLRRHSPYEIREYVQAYLMILMSMIGMAVFVLYPISWVLRWSLFSYNGLTTARYVGISNFVRAFTRDPAYWMTVANTFALALGKLAVELPLALVMAYILDKKFALRHVFRTLYFLPTIISVAIAGVIFYFLFASYDGVVNNVLMAFGVVQRPINWFATKWSALLVTGIASIWQTFGITMVLFLTGLQSISRELYESADIDGAREHRKLLSITIPMLGPVMQIIIMVALLGSLKITDLILVLTGGRPAGKTEVMMTYIYKKFFADEGAGTAADFGYAAALSVITSVILGVVTFMYLRYSRKQSSIY